jgi:hypothetical protein
MGVSVRPMNEMEFASFQEESARVYVSQLTASGNLSLEEAERRARAEGLKILPDGMATKGAVLLSIFKNAEQIGYLWFDVRERGNIKTAFSYAFEIYPYGKGCGYSAMIKAREYLRAIGVQKVSLHAFSKNERVVELYKAVGFRVDSYNMSVEL